MNETVHRNVTIYVEIRAGNLSKRQSHGQSLFIDPISSQSYQPTSNLRTVNIDTRTIDDQGTTFVSYESNCKMILSN